MAQDDGQPTSRYRAGVWDTEDVDAWTAAEIFRGAARSGFLPWTSQPQEIRSFKTRFEFVDLPLGFIGRIKTTPIISTRTRSDIAASPDEFFYASFVLSGSMSFEQQGRENIAHPGDLVVFDSARPARVSSRPSSGRKCSSAIALMIPKSSFSWVNAEDRLTNVCIPRTKLLAPLSTTLNFLSSRLTEDVGEEFLGLYDACVAMLPIAAGCFDKRSLALEMRGASRPLREIVEFIDDSLGHANFTAQIAADALGLSERYVHKLFAKQGSTFGAYVTAKRLDHARNELMGPQRPSKPISLIAYGSGFNDLSTFNRAFRKQFGCTPSAMRDSKVKEPNAE